MEGISGLSSNNTLPSSSSPLLPTYTLTPLPPLLPHLSDFHLSLLLPVAAYWLMSLTFHLIDKYDLWSQHRIHTPEEFKQRNRVSVREVLRSVIFQQAIQTALGLWIGYLTDPGDEVGREEFDVAVWAGRVHRAVQQAGIYIPYVLATVGIDAKTLGHNIHTYAAALGPTIGTANNKPLALMNLVFSSHEGQVWTSAYSAWEIYAAKTIYWVLEPAARFGIAIFFSDSWQYFWHRAMHSNRWMYRKPFPLTLFTFPTVLPSQGFHYQTTPTGLESLTTFLLAGNMHAHHHKIYVPYAFGAFYNTLSEAFLLDTIGTTLSLMLSGLTIRQTMCFSTISVMKGVDDHCGYRLPWDPLQWGNEQNTQFHDVHHQSWGIKVCLSSLWDSGRIVL